MVRKTWVTAAVLVMTIGTYSVSIAPAVRGEDPTDPDRFVETWIARFQNGPWMTEYLNSTTVVDDGYGGLSIEEKQGLVVRLMREYEVVNASFFAMLNPEGANASVLDERHQIASQILYNIVFDKVEFMDQVLGRDREPAGEDTAEFGESRYFPGLTLEEIARRFEAQRNETMVLKDVDALVRDLDLTETDDLATVPTRLVDVGTLPTQSPVDLTAALADAGHVAPDLAELALPDVPLPAEVPPLDLALAAPREVVDALPASLVDAPKVLPPLPRDFAALVATALASTTYTVCWAPRGAPALSCNAVPEPLNVPTPVNTDTDSLPEIMVTLTAPANPAALPDPSLGLDVRRVDTATLADPMPVIVLALYRPPGTSGLFAIAGIDGREFTLPQATTATAAITGFATDDPGLSLRLATGVAGAAVSLVGGVASSRTTATGGIELYDYSLATARLAPVPPVFTLDLSDEDAARFVGTTLERGRNLTGALEVSAPARVTLGLFREEERPTGLTEVTVAEIDFADIARRVDVRALVFPSDSVAEYHASRDMGRLSFTAAKAPDDRDLRTFHLDALLNVEGVPAEMTFEFGGARFSYRASAVVTRVEVAQGDVVAGRIVELTYAEARSVPTAIDVSVTDGRVDVVANAPVGVINFLQFDGPGTPFALAGDHFLTVRQDTPSGTFRLTSARLTGFQEAHHVDLDDGTRTNVVIRGHQPFTYLAQRIRLNGDSRTEIGVISRLPETLEVTVIGDSFTYSASESVDRIVFQSISKRGARDRLTHAEMDGVPARFSVDVQADADQAAYEASSRVRRILVAQIETRPGRYEAFVAEVNDLPTSIRVNWGDSAFAMRTDARLGRVALQVLRTSGASTDFAFAEVRDLPTTLLATWTRGGNVDLTTDSEIGSVTLAASNFGGYFTLPGDGVLAYDVGGRQSVYARVTGLASLHASLSQRFFSLDLAKPLPFTALAITDAATAYAFIDALPQHLEVAFNGNSVMYKASSTIAQVVLYYRDATQAGSLVLTRVPSRVLANFGANPSLDLGDGIGRVEFAYERGRPALGLCCGIDYVTVIQDGSGALGIAGRLSEVRSFSSDLGGRHVTLDMSQNYPFAAYVNVPGLLGYVTLSNVPGHITVDVQPSALTYSATSPIYRATAYVETSGTVGYASIVRAPRLLNVAWTSSSLTVHTDAPIESIAAVGSNAQGTVALLLQGLPSTMRLTWNVGDGGGSIVYDADGRLGLVRVQAASGARGAFVEITGIPRHVEVGWGEKSAYLSTSEPIGSIWAMATNDGAFSYLGGDHALYYNVGSTTRASFRLSGLRGFSFSNSGATSTFRLDLAGGQYFNVFVLDERSGRRMYVNGWLGPLPASTVVNLGPVTTISLSSNMDIAVYAQSGPISSLDGNWWTPPVPEPYFTHGLVARATPDMSAIKATLYLTGLPTYVMLDPAGKHVVVNNFRPRIGWIFVDLDKRDLSAQAYLASPANDYDFRIGSGDKSMSFTMSANANMGIMWASVRTPEHRGYVEISNIPAYVSFGYSGGSGATSAYYSANIPIRYVFAGYHRPWIGFWQAYVYLRDVPTYMSFNLGDSDAGFNLGYSASASTLDVEVYVDPSLFGGNFRARVFAVIYDLGYYTQAWKSGSSFNLYSAPSTGLLYVNVDAEYSYSYGNSGGGGSWWFGYSWHVYIDVYVRVDDLFLYLEGLRYVSVRPEIPTLHFTYFDASYLAFGWRSVYVALNLDVGGSVHLLGFTIISVHIHWYPRFYVNIQFDTWTAHWYRVWEVCISTWWDRYCAYMDGYPHPHYRFNNAFALWNWEDGGVRERWVFINPFGIIPWWAEWLYMTFAKGGVRFGCC